MLMGRGGGENESKVRLAVRPRSQGAFSGGIVSRWAPMRPPASKQFRYQLPEKVHSWLRLSPPNSVACVALNHEDD
jgi:hypothetical protein